MQNDRPLSIVRCCNNILMSTIEICLADVDVAVSAYNDSLHDGKLNRQPSSGHMQSRNCLKRIHFEVEVCHSLFRNFEILNPIFDVSTAAFYLLLLMECSLLCDFDSMINFVCGSFR